MRDRIERKATKTATTTARERELAPDAVELSPLLALQRSAGNAAVVAMLDAGDRAAVEADRLPDAALRRTSTDTSAFTSAPVPRPSVSPGLDEPIRRIWTQKTQAQGMGVDFEIMDTAKFEGLVLGPGVVRDDVHDRIQDRLDGYLDAVEKDNWELADATLDLMMSQAKVYLRYDPVGQNRQHEASKGMRRFLDACKNQKEEISGFLRVARLVGPGTKSGGSSTARQQQAAGSTSSRREPDLGFEL